MPRSYVNRIITMKTILFVLSLLSLSAHSARAATIALWTFESPNVPGTVTGTSISGLVPNIGSGTASGVHASGATVFSSAVGNGSSSALSANSWAPGDYWEFHVSTVGFTSLQLSFAQRADSTGPTNFNLAYSLNHTSFTTVLSFYQVRADNSGGGWNSSTPNLTTIRTVDLSAVTQVNNAPDVYFRLTSNIGGPSSGTGRIDDFSVTATAIPEPASLAIIGIAVLALSRHAAFKRGNRP